MRKINSIRQRIRKLLIGLMLSAGCPLMASESAVPEMDDAGVIHVGTKSIELKHGFNQYRMLLAESLEWNGGGIFNFGKGDFGVVFFPNKKCLREGNAITWTSDIVPTRGEDNTILGQYVTVIQLRDDGMIYVKNSYKLNPGVTVKHHYFYMRGVAPLTGFYTIEGRKTPLGTAQVNVVPGSGTEFTFFPDDVAKRFKIIPITCQDMSVIPETGTFAFNFQNNCIEFLVDLRGESKVERSEEYYGNTDFGKLDGLRLPQYRLSRNLIQNPSFEAGLRFWSFKNFGNCLEKEYNDVYQISTDQAVFGTHSLKIDAFKERLMLPLSTFAIPLQVGKTYVLSFYVKGDPGQDLILQLDGRGTSVFAPFAGNTVKNIPVTDQWVRHSLEVTPQKSFYSFYFAGFLADSSPLEKGEIFLDGVQLEEKQLTEYTDLPVYTQLLSRARGNLLCFGDDPEFKLVVNTAAGGAGAIDLSVRDFFETKLYTTRIPFDSVAGQDTVIPLPELDRRINDGRLRGAFVVDARIMLQADPDMIYRDFYRFSVMTPMNGTHKNKNIFAFSPKYSNFMSEPDVDRRLQRMVDFGFGAIVWLEEENRIIEKRLSEKAASFRLDCLGRPVIDKWSKGGFIAEDGRMIENLQEIMVNPTQEQLRQYEDICALKAGNRPWVRVWSFSGEIEGFQPLVGDEKALARVLNATWRGIKRGNPSAKVHMGCAPWNINENGRHEMARYLAGLNAIGTNVKFDGTNMHIYQALPENPDLDDSMRDYLQLLACYGYQDEPVYLDEGVNYFEYLIPIEAYSPYYGNSGSTWYMGKLSYDMGRAERIATAFTARTYLVGLKYSKNVACIFDFDYLRYFWDADYTSGAKMKMVNTLNRLLGNATFRTDVRFGVQSRAYVFMNDSGRPVAALWTHDPEVDRYEKAPPVFRIDFGTQQVEFIDLMENPATFPQQDGRYDVTVGAWPLFILGESGREEEFIGAIQNALNCSDRSLPVEIHVRPVTDGKARIRVRNNVARTINADATMNINGTRIADKLHLEASAAAEEEVAFSPIQKNGIPAFVFAGQLQRGDERSPEFRIDGSYTLITSRAAPGWKWDNVPVLPMEQGILVRMSYDPDLALILQISYPEALESKRKTILVNPLLTDGNWSDDFVKTQDLFVFELKDDAELRPRVFVHWVPKVQADSGAQTPKANVFDHRIVVTRMTDHGRVTLEVEIPAISIMPVLLRSGAFFGVNVVFSGSDEVFGLAPVTQYVNPENIGQVRFLLSIVQ